MYIGEFQFGQRQGHGELQIHLDSQHNPNRIGLGKNSKELVELVLKEWDIDNPIVHSGNWNNNEYIHS